MASNKTLDLTIRIAGKMDKSLLSAISGTQSRVSDLARTVSRVGTAGLTAMGALTTGTVAAIASCTREATDFENQMANVVKYVDGLADATGKISDSIWKVSEGGNGKAYVENYAAMKDAILDLSTQIPYTAEDLTKLAAAAGQSGKSMDDITGGFLKDAAMWGKAMDISADQAGDWAAKWEVAFNMNHEQIMSLADQINYLGANNATTAAEIAQVVNDSASLGQVAGISPDATAAMGTAMLAMGVDAGKTANSVKRIFTNISKGSSATDAMKKQWVELGFTAEGVAKSMQTDGVGTMKSIFQAINQLPEERQVAALSTLFGQWAIEGGAKIAGNLEYYAQVMDSVTNPANYKDSMLREFTIKSDTPEAVRQMRDSAWSQLKIGFGDSFLPVQKDLDLAMRDLFVRLNDNMPQIGQLGETLAELASNGVSKLGDALETALPYIQTALDYLADNGPQVMKLLGGLAGTFAAMKFAPGITGLLGGAGDLLLGTKSGAGSYAARTGGLSGMLSGLWKGGQSAGGKAVDLFSAFGGAAKGNGFLRTLSATVSSFLSGNGIAGTTDMLTAGAGTPGLLSGFQGVGGLIKNTIAASGPGQYIGGIISSVKNVGSVFSAESAARAAPATLANSGAGSIISGALGSVGNVVKAGGGVLSSIWGPMASGFGGLLSGALPIVGVISSIIAMVSILGDHLEDIRGIIGNVFGPSGVAVFDIFIGGLQRVGDFITGLFKDGGVAQAMAPLRDAITGMFGDDAGAAFDGLVQILQSVMSVAGQVVTFANTTVKPIIQEIFGFITQTVVPIILQTFTAAAPTISGIIFNLGSAVMSGMQIIGIAIQTALPIIEGVISVVLSIASVVIPALLAGYEVFSSGLATIVSAIETVFQGIIDVVGGVFTRNWTQVWQGVLDIFGGIFEGLGALVKTPLNAVISIINNAISGINGLGLTIPDWVPGIGGKSFSINIPAMPMLAKGGFTNGPSIAGEAGTEAVISFQKSARSQNIETWKQAGRMLGVGNRSMELLDLPAGAGGNPGFHITFAPHIEIKGNADRETVDRALVESEQRFEAWLEANFERFYNRMERERRRKAYA